MNPFRMLWLNVTRLNPVVLVAIVIVMAVVAMMLTNQKFTETEEEKNKIKQDYESKMNAKGSVVMAKKDIPEGEIITSDMLELKETEQSKIPIDALTSLQMAQGQTAKVAIGAGQMLRNSDFAVVAKVATFDQKIKEGYRAVTFGIDTNSGVAGFLTPECHVDIIASAGSAADTKAAPILSDVEIIAVGQTYQKASAGSSAPTPASCVTVAVSPEDADKLIRAIMAAKLYLTLRSEKDNTPLATVDVTSLFQKAGDANGGGGGGGAGGAGSPDQMANLPSASQLPAPPAIPGADDANGGNDQAGNGGGDVAPPPLHEIEIWSGSSKNVLQVPQG